MNKDGASQQARILAGHIVEYVDENSDIYYTLKMDSRGALKEMSRAGAPEHAAALLELLPAIGLFDQFLHAGKISLHSGTAAILTATQPFPGAGIASVNVPLQPERPSSGSARTNPVPTIARAHNTGI
jgi:hypothetical protein